MRCRPTTLSYASQGASMRSGGWCSAPSSSSRACCCWRRSSSPSSASIPIQTAHLRSGARGWWGTVVLSDHPLRRLRQHGGTPLLGSRRCLADADHPGPAAGRRCRRRHRHGASLLRAHQPFDADRGAGEWSRPDREPDPVGRCPTMVVQSDAGHTPATGSAGADPGGHLAALDRRHEVTPRLKASSTSARLRDRSTPSEDR